MQPIRDILGRLQYTHPSQGDTPHSKDYLQALGLDTHILSDRTNSADDNNYNSERNITQSDTLRDLRSILSPLSPQATTLSPTIGSPSILNSSQALGQTSLPPLQNLSAQLGPLNRPNTVGQGTTTGALGETNNQGELIGQLVHTIKNMNASQQQNLVKGIAQMLTGTSNSPQIETQSSLAQLSSVPPLTQRPQLQAQQVQFQPGQGVLGVQNSDTPLLTQESSRLRFNDNQNFQRSRSLNNNSGYPSQFIVETPTANGMIRSYSSASASNNTFNEKSELYPESGISSKANGRGRNGHHKNLSGPDNARKFICPKCGVAFKRSSDLKRHEKIHLPVPPNICPLCKTGFARKDALKRHIDTMTCRRNRKRLLESLKKKKTNQNNNDKSTS